MKTYEDFLKAENKEDFIKTAISQHKTTNLYLTAIDAKNYYDKKNTTIFEYQKWLRTITGELIPDIYSPNYKLGNAFFPIFVKQEASYLLGNGVNFQDAGTGEKLGTKENPLNTRIMDLALKSLWGGVSFGFWNLDHIEVFDILEFVPLLGEEDGAMHAGIRFWQVSEDKPLRATLYEEDGYSDHIWSKGEYRILRDKTPYKLTVQQSEIDGLEILDGKNYPTLPIVPLWANLEKQSEFIGLKEKIDGYDLIMSGFADDVDEAAIYWTIKNAGGMDDVDLAQFIERMRSVKAAVVDDEGSTAEAHTIDLPYNARAELLKELRDALYRDAMALDTDKISAGNVTATAIEASYENLNLKCDGFETCVKEFLNSIMSLAGVEDTPSFVRSKIVNVSEITNMVLASAQYLDDETILRHLPFLANDEIDNILDNLVREESMRYEEGQGENMDGQEIETDGAESDKDIQEIS